MIESPPLTSARDAVGVLASVYAQCGRPADAAILFAAVAQIDPEATWALCARCVALLRADQHETAEAEARALLGRALPERDRVPLLIVLAMCTHARGQLGEARANYRLATDLAAGIDWPEAAFLT